MQINIFRVIIFDYEVKQDLQYPMDSIFSQFWTIIIQQLKVIFRFPIFFSLMECYINLVLNKQDIIQYFDMSYEFLYIFLDVYAELSAKLKKNDHLYILFESNYQYLRVQAFINHFKVILILLLQLEVSVCLIYIYRKLKK